MVPQASPAQARPPFQSPGSCSSIHTLSFLPRCPGRGQLRLSLSALLVFSPWLQQGEAPVSPKNRDVFHLPPALPTHALGAALQQRLRKMFFEGKPLGASLSLIPQPGRQLRAALASALCQPCHCGVMLLRRVMSVHREQRELPAA